LWNLRTHSSLFSGFISTNPGASENRSDTMKHWKNWNDGENGGIDTQSLCTSLLWKHVAKEVQQSSLMKLSENACFS
jgi:hypothetical protein